MRPSQKFFLKALLLPLFLPAAELTRTCSVRELNDIWPNSGQTSETLTVTGTVQYTNRVWFALSDASGYARVYNSTHPQPVPGTVVRVICHQKYTSDHDKQILCRQWSSLGTAPIAPPLVLRLGELDEQQHNLRNITVEGTVVDVVRDEIDSKFHILLLKDGATTLPCFVEQAVTPRNLQDARVRLTGIYHRLVSGFRRFSGPFIAVSSDISVLASAPADLLNAPVIDPSNYMTPKEVAKMGRHSLIGTVLATWEGNQAMVRAKDTVIGAVFTRDVPLPPCGATVKVSGYPGTDLYRLILSKCVWAKVDAPEGQAEEDEVTDISPRQILLNDTHIPQINSKYHGQLIRLRGVVRTLPNEDSGDRRMIVETDGFRIPVDYSSSPSAAVGITPGFEVEVTGRCLMESGNWQPYEIFPQISGFAVVLRTPADLHVVRSPPWWTSFRLMVLVVTLVAGLLALALWNFLLKRKSESRGKALYEEKIGHALAEQKVEERTRLAVELHDSVSQTLTGVALQLDGGEVETAKTMLASCRGELRRCLWDLRSRTFEEKDMTEAVTRTIAPHLNGCTATVRFNVPRERLSESLTHAILRIVRELVVNAIQHGQASRVKIAGELHDGIVSFSVADDGRGFNPDAAPGPNQGHFGLLGVRERIENFNGTLKTVSAPNQGAKFTVTLSVSDETNER